MPLHFTTPLPIGHRKPHIPPIRHQLYRPNYYYSDFTVPIDVYTSQVPNVLVAELSTTMPPKTLHAKYYYVVIILLLALLFYKK